MRVSNLFGATLKETPAEADAESHQLLLRAGYLRQLGSGLFCYLPLAWRALQRIEAVLRDEMDGIGGQELSLPVVHPAETWQASGRWDAVGPELLRFVDRRGADHCLAMTHEEVVAFLVRSEVRSYRQLPMLVYQIQTKFRDEPRARGGLIRVREFTMKDSYSIDRDAAGLQLQYDAHHAAYLRIFSRLGLPVVVVASDPGMMGGKVAHEFMYVAPVGEDHLVLCGGCDYAANREVARFQRQAVDAPAEPLDKVATPGAKTIAALCEFLGIEADKTAKVVLVVATFDDERDDALVMALVRGDMEVNPVALGAALGASGLRPALEPEIRAVGVEPGYASAIGLAEEHRAGLVVVADEQIVASPALVAGANEAGFHLTGTRAGRDYTPDHVAAIALAYEGAACELCGGQLRQARGVEVGNIFQLGARYTDAVGATWLDENGRTQPFVLGSYGIGVGRLLACIAEEHRDDDGLCWPIAVAPYEVALVALVRKAPARASADALYEELRAAGISVLFDDRPKVSPGVKLAEADLRGLPLRVVISDRGLKAGTIEIKRRRSTEPTVVPIAEAVEAVRAELAALWDETRG